MKPTVQYIADKHNFIVIGLPAFVHPINHPNHKVGHAVSNTTFVRTSPVISKHAKGFETMNTIYEEKQNAAE